MMDLREKLILDQKVKYGEESICKNCFHHGICRGENNQPCFECNRFVDANGVTVQEWIPSYEYPEKTGFYICLYKSPYGDDLWKVGQCYWNGTNWTTVGFMPLAVQVKQYTPLPEPPKGD